MTIHVTTHVTTHMTTHVTTRTSSSSISLPSQFHDVLPGSAIGMVYDVALKRYAEIVPQLVGLRDQALTAALRPALPAATSVHTSTGGCPVLVSEFDVFGAKPLPYTDLQPPADQPATSNCFVFNSLGFPRTEVIEVPVSLVPPGYKVSARLGSVQDYEEGTMREGI